MVSSQRMMIMCIKQYKLYSRYHHIKEGKLNNIDFLANEIVDKVERTMYRYIAPAFTSISACSKLNVFCLNLYNILHGPLIIHVLWFKAKSKYRSTGNCALHHSTVIHTLRNSSTRNVGFSAIFIFD
jgi:hypothetical protein